MSDFREFISKLSRTSERARDYGRKHAVEHYCALTGAPEQDGAKLYDDLAHMYVGCPVIYNLPLAEMAHICSTGEHRLNNPILTFNRSRSQSEKAMGLHGLDPLYADAMTKTEGDRKCGDCSIVLRAIDDRTAFLCGDPNRLRNPARPDYVESPEFVLYHRSDMNHCRAAATMLGLTKSELLGGPKAILAEVGRPDVDYGRCKAIIFGGISPENIQQVVTDDKEKAIVLRNALHEAGRLLPVRVSAQKVRIKDPFSEKEEPDSPPEKESAQQLMFMPGGRVCVKPSFFSSMGSKPGGTVMGVNDTGMTVQWDNGGRTKFDLVEALTMLMPMPEPSVSGNGMVTYSLPGVSADALKVLNKNGIDAVTLYSVLSHAQPGGDSLGGWKELVPKLLKTMGLDAQLVKGFIPSPEDSDLAFAQHEWYEVSLPNGVRLVMDIGAGKILVRAGADLDDYVRPSHEPLLELE